MEKVRSWEGANRLQRMRRVFVSLAAGLVVATALYFHFLPPYGVPGGPVGETVSVDGELLENLDLIKDLDFLVEYGEELDLAMEYDLFNLLHEGESM
jgi:hypothetical protein